MNRLENLNRKFKKEIKNSLENRVPYPKILKIEPGVWHGYKALQSESIMMYYLNEKYDKKDEWKVKPGHFGESWKTEDK